MNEKLKFSWGHIIAIIALVAIVYFSFVGTTYREDGNFLVAGITTIVIATLLALFFFGAQAMKATDVKFSRCIWAERVFVFGSPVVFILVMLPYFHFWTVHSRNSEIVVTFKSAISASEKMFDNYEDYAQKRIANYDSMLERVINNRALRPDEFSECGFTDDKVRTQKTNMVKTLRLQLLSENYDSLKTTAKGWIRSANNGASTYNVFLLGNVKEIRSSIHEWDSQLNSFAEKRLSNEDFRSYNVVMDYNTSTNGLAKVDSDLNSLTDKFVGKSFPGLWSILLCVVLYFALLLPYLLQERNTKSTYRLIGNVHDKRNGGEDGSIVISSQQYNKNDGFESFTI